MAKSGIKVFIEVVVEDTWICDLRNPETFYSNVTALTLSTTFAPIWVAYMRWIW